VVRRVLAAAAAVFFLLDAQDETFAFLLASSWCFLPQLPRQTQAADGKDIVLGEEA
jgi:hypothetical protein